MSAFDDLDDDMQDALDDAYGERIRIVPQGVGGFRMPVTADPTRAVAEIIGRYRSKPATSELEGNREGSKFQSMTRIAVNVPTLRISPTQLALLGYVPQANDRVVFLGRVDEPSFAIVRSGLRDSGEANIELTSGPAA